MEQEKQNLINCLKWRHSRSDTLLFFISISAALTDKIQLIITLCLFLPRQSFAQREGGGGGGGGGGRLSWMDEKEKLFTYSRVKVPALSFAEHQVCSTTDTETRTNYFFGGQKLKWNKLICCICLLTGDLYVRVSNCPYFFKVFLCCAKACAVRK